MQLHIMVIRAYFDYMCSCVLSWVLEVNPKRLCVQFGGQRSDVRDRRNSTSDYPTSDLRTWITVTVKTWEKLGNGQFGRTKVSRNVARD